LKPFVNLKILKNISNNKKGIKYNTNILTPNAKPHNKEPNINNTGLDSSLYHFIKKKRELKRKNHKI
jgi:hypothetical protein